jgi:hypothetical protein
LIYIQERTGGPELIGGNHELASSNATHDGIYCAIYKISKI